MGKKSRLKKERLNLSKKDNIGSLSEQLTAKFQQELRNSEMWNQMVKEFGEERAEQILQECKADIKPI